MTESGNQVLDVSYGSQADVRRTINDVGFTPQITDIDRRLLHVSFGPRGDILGRTEHRDVSADLQFVACYHSLNFSALKPLWRRVKWQSALENGNSNPRSASNGHGAKVMSASLAATLSATPKTRSAAWRPRRRILKTSRQMF